MIRTLMGHSSLTTMARYCSASTAQKLAVYRRAEQAEARGGTR